MFHACEVGDVDEVQRIIYRSSSIQLFEKLNKRGDTPLHVAARCGHAPVVELLITAGAPIDHCNSDGKTPLHHAAFAPHVEVVKQLMAAGANPLIRYTCRSFLGWAPLDGAAAQGHVEVVKILAQYKPANTHQPIANQHRYVTSRTAKRQASQELNKVMMDALYNAVNARHWEVVKELLAHVDINRAPKRENRGKSVLGFAIDKFNIDQVQYLVEHGADVNGSENTIPPLLHVLDDLPLAKYLLEKGANINNKQDPTLSPIYVACSKEKREIVKLMMQYGAVADSLLFVAQDEVVARRLIVLGANVNCLNSYERTPLSHAADERKVEMVEMLLQFGAKVDLGFGSSRSALEYARKYRRTCIKSFSIRNPVTLTNLCLLVVAANFSKLAPLEISSIVDNFVFN